jgi:hypothetical protein
MSDVRPSEPRDRSGSSEYAKVRETVFRHYPTLAAAVEACLAVFGSMALAGRTKPLSVMFEAHSGFGKTAVLQMLFPEPGSPLAKHVYRSDKFTPKSFVTHAANVSREELTTMDLLPKLEGRVLVTKELAPIFRGREQDLQENFSILISVLDGKGFTSDSGMRGQRGYERPIMFNWIGATTPLPVETHRLMSQLGTRLLFYEIDSVPPTENDLFEYAKKEGADSAERECRIAVTEFLTRFFDAHPVGSVPLRSIQICDSRLLELVKWGMFLVAARAEVKWEKDGTNPEPIAAMPPEGPHKVVLYFMDLARGHALVHGRDAVDDADLELIGHVAISSVPGQLRPIVRELRQASAVTTKTAAALCRVSAPTARKNLKQLSLLGICDLKKGGPITNESDEVQLATAYRWLNPNLEIQV